MSLFTFHPWQLPCIINKKQFRQQFYISLFLRSIVAVIVQSQPFILPLPLCCGPGLACTTT
jgi:hypothetical protein